MSLFGRPLAERLAVQAGGRIAGRAAMGKSGISAVVFASAGAD
jgi:hypothetical protein